MTTIHQPTKTATIAHTVTAAINRRDVDALLACYTADVRCTDPAATCDGPDAVAACWQGWWNAFSSLTITVDNTFGDDERRANQWTLRAVNDGPFPLPDGTTLPATGHTVEIRGGSILQLQAGRIRRQHDYYDVTDLMTQLGIINPDSGK